MRYHNRRKKKAFITIVLLCLFIIYGFMIVDRNIRPTVLAISEVKARMMATQAINDSVRAKVTDDINYKDLIFVRYDNEGQITMMQANTILMNNIASDVALEVQDRLRKIAVSKIEVPLGNAFDSQLLAQWGPKVGIQIVPQGTVTVDFTTEFQESGINQTIHKIYLVIITDVKVIIPLASDTVRVTTTVPIAETVIVGDVPNSYINVPKEDFLNVVPTE